MTNLASTQIKVTVPQELYGFIKSKADKFGLSTSAYIKNLIIDDVKDLEIPVFKMSSKRERIALEALKEYKAGKTEDIDNIDDYLNAL